MKRNIIKTICIAMLLGLSIGAMNSNQGDAAQKYKTTSVKKIKGCNRKCYGNYFQSDNNGNLNIYYTAGYNKKADTQKLFVKPIFPRGKAKRIKTSVKLEASYPNTWSYDTVIYECKDGVMYVTDNKDKAETVAPKRMIFVYDDKNGNNKVKIKMNKLWKAEKKILDEVEIKDLYLKNNKIYFVLKCREQMAVSIYDIQNKKVSKFNLLTNCATLEKIRVDDKYVYGRKATGDITVSKDGRITDTRNQVIMVYSHSGTFVYKIDYTNYLKKVTDVNVAREYSVEMEKDIYDSAYDIYNDKVYIYTKKGIFVSGVSKKTTISQLQKFDYSILGRDDSWCCEFKCLSNKKYAVEISPDLEFEGGTEDIYIIE